MMKKGKFLFLITLCFTITAINAQSYSINSFDGNRVKINLYYKPASGILTINYLRDTLLINDYLSVDKVNVINRVFLQISYIKRAGSNENAMNQLLLYVSNDKLVEALHVNSLIAFDIRPSEYSLFKLKLLLTGYKTDEYKLTIHIHDEHTISSNPQSNYNYNKISFLTFDKKDKIFYSAYEHITGDYTFHSFKNGGRVRTTKGNLKKDIAVVKIEKDKYYYINGDWYTKDKGDFYSMLL